MLRSVERLLLPPACLLCDERVPPSAGDALVCALCRTRWRRVPDPVCVRCGQPRDLVTRELICRLCAEWVPGLDRVRSAVWLDGNARLAVHRLKYDGWWRVAEAMADAMGTLAPLTAGVSLLPVPLAAARQRRRGYNQSERIATALAERTGLPLGQAQLRRVRETPTQTALAPAVRAANVAGAFRASGAGAGIFVLVDDVFTTGATLAAAAAALVAAGARRVEAVTFARAAPPVA